MIFKSTVPILYPFPWYYVHIFTVIQALQFTASIWLGKWRCGEMVVEHPKSFTRRTMMLLATTSFCLGFAWGVLRLLAHIYTLFFLYWLACLCYMQISYINAILQMLHICSLFFLLFINPVCPPRSEFL